MRFHRGHRVHPDGPRGSPEHHREQVSLRRTVDVVDALGRQVEQRAADAGRPPARRTAARGRRCVDHRPGRAGVARHEPDAASVRAGAPARPDDVTSLRSRDEPSGADRAATVRSCRAVAARPARARRPRCLPPVAPSRSGAGHAGRGRPVRAVRRRRPLRGARRRVAARKRRDATGARRDLGWRAFRGRGRRGRPAAGRELAGADAQCLALPTGRGVPGLRRHLVRRRRIGVGDRLARVPPLPAGSRADDRAAQRPGRRRCTGAAQPPVPSQDPAGERPGPPARGSFRMRTPHAPCGPCVPAPPALDVAPPTRAELSSTSDARTELSSTSPRRVRPPARTRERSFRPAPLHERSPRPSPPGMRNGAGHHHGRVVSGPVLGTSGAPRRPSPAGSGLPSGSRARSRSRPAAPRHRCRCRTRRGCSSRRRSSAAHRRPRGPPPWAEPGCCGTG